MDVKNWWQRVNNQANDVRNQSTLKNTVFDYLEQFVQLDYI